MYNISITYEFDLELPLNVLNKESNLYNYRYLLSHVKVIYCKNELDMELLETYLINKLKPYLNIDYKITKIKNKFNTKNIEEKALKYQKQWEEKILKPIEVGAYKRQERIELFCNQIKEKMLTENIAFPVRVGVINENFRMYLKYHWSDQSEEINNIMKLYGFQIIELKDRYGSKTKYVIKI
jgi:hypothetical protein